MYQRFRKSSILKLLPWILFVLSIGIGIGLYIKPIPRGFDTFTFIVGALTIFGAFMVAMTWNSLEDRIRKANEQQDKRIEEVDKKINDMEERINAQEQKTMALDRSHVDFLEQYTQDQFPYLVNLQRKEE